MLCRTLAHSAIDTDEVMFAINNRQSQGVLLVTPMSGGEGQQQPTLPPPIDTIG